MLSIGTIAALSTLTTTPADFKAYGFELLQRIERDYALKGTPLLAEKRGSTQPSFNWGVGVTLSAYAAASELDPAYKPKLRAYADAARVYWNARGPVPGYDVVPNQRGMDRYYDDNAWMVMALVETYEALDEVKYLDWAEETLRYVLSGEDDKLGGGIWWKEAEKTTKNTCSNGPAAAACLAVAKHRNRTQYRATAKRIFRWTVKNLMDPSDHLFWDHVRLDGSLEKTKWSYNTALMIRAGRDLDRAAANRWQEAALKKWVSPEGIRDEGRFAHLLLENLRGKGQRIHPSAVSALDLLIKTKALPNGFFRSRWDATPTTPVLNLEILDQVSVVRACFVVALRG